MSRGCPIGTRPEEGDRTKRARQKLQALWPNPSPWGQGLPFSVSSSVGPPVSVAGDRARALGLPGSVLLGAGCATAAKGRRCQRLLPGGTAEENK